jgi:hypothetical protein
LDLPINATANVSESRLLLCLIDAPISGIHTSDASTGQQFPVEGSLPYLQNMMEERAKHGDDQAGTTG